MKKINLTEEELVTMSYDDVAYVILESVGKKMKTPDLFKEVIRIMNLSDAEFENHLADFFELLSTDKRFTMVEKGYWDLKINQKTKLIIDDEDEEDEIVENIENDTNNNEEDEEINYDEEILDDDDAEDDLKDLVIMDDPEENEII